MQLSEAVERILLGEPLQSVAADYRSTLLQDCGLEPAEAGPRTFQPETRRFMNRLCRELAHRHEGDSRAAAALHDWVHRVDDYDAFDALLSGFGQFDGREAIVRRGRTLFPGPLTAHWEES
jgi:hypothetical protein